MPFDHTFPRFGTVVLEGNPLTINAIIHDDRIMAFLDGPEDITTQNHTIIHFDGYVPLDPHPVFDLTLPWVHRSILGKSDLCSAQGSVFCSAIAHAGLAAQAIAPMEVAGNAPAVGR